MTAEEMFEKLGYKLTENNFNDIQYTKKSEKSELQRIGMIITNRIEFYTDHKEIVIYTEYEHEDGSISKCDTGVLNLKEFNAVKKQISELGWQD